MDFVRVRFIGLTDANVATVPRSLLDRYPDDLELVESAPAPAIEGDLPTSGPVANTPRAGRRRANTTKEK